MTVASTLRRAGPYTGNGVTTAFAFAFKVFAAADLVVTEANLSSVETVLVLTTDYTVTLNADQDANPGGQITLLAALTTGFVLAITSNVAATQTVVVTNAGGFFPAVFNNVFDKCIILIQQLMERGARNLAVSVTAPAGIRFDVPVLAGGVLQWNAAGDQLVPLALPDLSLSLALPPYTGNNGKVLGLVAGVPTWVVQSAAGAVPSTRLVNSAGLMTGGGALSGDLTLTVPAAAAADVRTATDVAKAVTSKALSDAAAFVALTDGSTIATDCAAGFNFKVTMAGNRTFGAPTSPRDGMVATWDISQDATGSRVPSFNAVFDWGVNGTPTFSTGANKRDKVVAQYSAAATKWDANFRKSA